MTNDNDLIRRGDALTILSNGSQTWGEAVAAIAALPAVAASQTADPAVNADSRQRVTVKPLVFDDFGVASDNLLNETIVYRKPEDQDRHKARRAASILAAIEPQPDPRDEVIVRLVEALDHIRSRAISTRGDQAYREFPRFAEKAVRAALAAAKAVQHG